MATFGNLWLTAPRLVIYALDALSAIVLDPVYAFADEDFIAQG